MVMFAFVALTAQSVHFTQHSSILRQFNFHFGTELNLIADTGLGEILIFPRLAGAHQNNAFKALVEGAVCVEQQLDNAVF